MPLDPKIANHVCSVIRRQIQNYIPELYLHFIVHDDDSKAEEFSKNTNTLREHPAGKHILNYHDHDFKQDLFQTNASVFSCLAQHKKSGFLGFFKDRAYLALCFVNYTHFESEEDIRNHVTHIAWHAISTYKSAIKSKRDRANTQTDIKEVQNLIFPKLERHNLSYRNLMADIFSASLQFFQGNNQALNSLANQRIDQTLNKNLSFDIEHYPFPMCLDTFKYILKNDLPLYKKARTPLEAATRLTQELKNTYDFSTIEQWEGFCISAQQMAWLDYTPKQILSAALYTGENIHVQSIADIIAEYLQIKPEEFTPSDDYNPFADSVTTELIHKKRYNTLKYKIFAQIKKHSDFTILLDIAEKQNKQFHEHTVLGWCGRGFVRAADILRQEHRTDDFENTLKRAKETFDTETKSISWETLAYFSEHLFKTARNGDFLNQDTILKIVEPNEEFSSIYYTIKAIDDWSNKRMKDSSESKTHMKPPPTETKQFNISDLAG